MNYNSAFCFDLDGTVTRDEILPIIAKEAGIYEEISALTTATINGVIPFKESFLLRCKLLGSIPVKRIHEIINEVRFYGEIVEFINKNKSNFFIITGNLNIWIDPLINRIGCKYFSSKGSFRKDSLNVDDVLNKADALGDELAEDQAKEFKEKTGKDVHLMSSVSGKNTKEILFLLADVVYKEKHGDEEEEGVFTP